MDHSLQKIELSSALSAMLVDSMGDENSILRAMLVSTDKDNLVGRQPKKSRGRLKFLIENRHGSPFEHATLTFSVHCPIFVSREWMRHRVQSFNEQSGRYVEYEPKFYWPQHRPLVQEGKPGKYQFVEGSKYQSDYVLLAFHVSCQRAWDHYLGMLDQGIAKEVARMVLPVTTYTSFYATANLRNWLHFLSLRTTDDRASVPSYPLWEIDQLAAQVEGALVDEFPLTMELWNENGRVPV